MSQSENGQMDGWTVENDLIKLNKRFNKKKKRSENEREMAVLYETR